MKNGVDEKKKRKIWRVENLHEKMLKILGRKKDLEKCGWKEVEGGEVDRRIRGFVRLCEWKKVENLWRGIDGFLGDVVVEELREDMKMGGGCEDLWRCG